MNSIYLRIKVSRAIRANAHDFRHRPIIHFGHGDYNKSSTQSGGIVDLNTILEKYGKNRAHLKMSTSDRVFAHESLLAFEPLHNYEKHTGSNQVANWREFRAAFQQRSLPQLE